MQFYLFCAEHLIQLCLDYMLRNLQREFTLMPLCTEHVSTGIFGNLASPLWTGDHCGCNSFNYSVHIMPLIMGVKDTFGHSC